MEQRQREGTRIRSLIEKATNSTAPQVDTRILKAIKLTVRHSDSDLRFAAQTLMDLLKQNHSQVRLLALTVIDELFMRSKLFRSIVVENMKQMLILTVGFKRNLPLPGPPAVASNLRAKAMEFLEKWNDSYGAHYKHIRLGFDYLKNTLNLKFPDIQAHAARIEQEKMERESRSREILDKKYELLKSNFSFIKEQIYSTTNEINECLNMIPAKKQTAQKRDEACEEWTHHELRHIRLNALKEGEPVCENDDNKAVFDAMRELYKLLVTKHMVSVQEHITILIKADTRDNDFKNLALRELIDIRNLLCSYKKKCDEFGCSLEKSDDDAEDFWEEGKIEPFNEHASSINEEAVPSTSCVSENEWKDSDVRCAETIGGKLLTEAPALKSDSVNNKVFVSQVTERDEMSEMKTCLAPLRRGGLCQRRDSTFCLFHGKIIPRDEEGKPLHHNVPTQEATVLEADDASEKINGDVSKMDEEDEKRAKKRAKLAKIREHNEAVLRHAALASTSGFAMMEDGGHHGTSAETRSVRRNNKSTLASMLRKKVTVRDRLARRLVKMHAA